MTASNPRVWASPCRRARRIPCRRGEGAPPAGRRTSWEAGSSPRVGRRAATARVEACSPPLPPVRRERRGHDERRDSGEAEENEAVAAVPGGEVAEGDMREGDDEVEVVDAPQAQRQQAPVRGQPDRRALWPGGRRPAFCSSRRSSSRGYPGPPRRAEERRRTRRACSRSATSSTGRASWTPAPCRGCSTCSPPRMRPYRTMPWRGSWTVFQLFEHLGAPVIFIKFLVTWALICTLILLIHRMHISHLY